MHKTNAFAVEDDSIVILSYITGGMSFAIEGAVRT